ncbi:MAG: twin-arginine translocase TatA/TatE family subunit [Gaiella sp.]
MPFGLGIWELAILLGVLVLLFGAKGVPDAARRMGRGVREIQGAMSDLDPRKELDPRRLLEPPEKNPPPRRTSDARPEPPRARVPPSEPDA